jgi:hypothetical protein
MNKPADWLAVLDDRARARFHGLERGSEDFIAACVDVLSQLPPWNFSWDDLTDARIWRCRQQSFPQNGMFADFALTVWRSEDVFLDIYVWNGSETSIHDHHFAGAFRVVAGSYHQTDYRFSESQECAPGLWKGVLEINATQDLLLNNTYPIQAADGLIHRVLHPVCPSVTLCLRTTPLSPSLHVYFPAGYKVKAASLHVQKLYAQARDSWLAGDDSVALRYLAQFSPGDLAFCLGKFHSPEKDWIELMTLVQPDHAVVLREVHQASEKLHRQTKALRKVLAE